jgi:hypothetical protein
LNREKLNHPQTAGQEINRKGRKERKEKNLPVAAGECRLSSYEQFVLCALCVLCG